MLTSFGLGSGHGWDIPIFYFYGIGVFVFLGVLGGLLAALVGLIGALIRIASRWPGRASTAVGAERSTHALPIGQATAGPRDTMTPRNRPVLWPWFTAIPTLLLLAAALIAGAYTGRIVDSESAAAIKAADRDDPYWRWDDLLAHREQLPDAENAAIVMDASALAFARVVAARQQGARRRARHAPWPGESRFRTIGSHAGKCAAKRQRSGIIS